MITAGVDVGSVRAKAVVFDAASRSVVGTGHSAAGHRPAKVGQKVLAEALDAAECARDQLRMIVGTGYGRIALPFADDRITEITCHARGARFEDEDVQTVMDIGGQDSKVMVIDADGHPRDFAMNDRCAAGTGRFIEVMADALEVELKDFGQLALEAESPAQIASTCTVFAESEVVGLISEGVPRADIAAGLCGAIAHRIAGLAAGVLPRGPALLTGGVAMNDGVFEAVDDLVSLEVRRANQPLLTGAIGAAIIAAEKVSTDE